MNRVVTLAVALMACGVLIARSGLFATDAATGGLGFLLLALCIWPTLAWVWGGMAHLPLFEVYSFMHLIYYWMPAGKEGGDILALNQEQRLTVLGAASVYLACGQAAYCAMLRAVRRQSTRGWRFWDNQVSAMRGARLPWACVGLWLFHSFTSQSGFIWELVPGSLISTVRALCGTAGMLGIFVLAYKAGEGRLTGLQSALFVLAVLIGTLISFASGYLAIGALFAGNAFFAFMVGGRRLPVVALSLFLAFVSFLNYGKAEMRFRYWALGESAENLVELYSYWFRTSWEQFNLPADRRQGSMSAFERANLTSVYVAVVTQSPQPIPYLEGKTYLDSLPLLIPRVLWPDRPSLHVLMSELGLRYGIHVNVESSESTMISIGQVGEAWANGGWLSVALVGGFFGLFFSVGVRVSYRRSYATVGFLFGMSFVGFAANLEHLAGTLLMAFYQTTIMSLSLLYWLSRRSSQPPSPVKRFEKESSKAETGQPLSPIRIGE